MKWRHAGKLMKCGHVAIGEDERGNPVCVICIGINEGATEVADVTPSLEGRMARCSCGREVPSSFDLPFFEFRGGAEFDSYYCGHGGWD